MTWPPADLPIDFENATPQENTHPDAHNATNQTINADLVPEIKRVGALADTIGLYLPLSGGTLTGDLQVDGQIKSTGGGSKADPAFQIGPDKALGMFGNINSQWIRFTTDGEYRFQIGTEKSIAYGDLQVVGTVEPGKGNQTSPAIAFGGTSSGFYLTSPANAVATTVNGAYRHIVYEDRTRVAGYLQVDGQTKAPNGTKTAPAYSFTSDPDTGIYLYSAGITSITCAGKNIANFGSDGVSFPEGLATITGTAANLHIGANGQIRRITDVAKAPTTADVSRLESVIETLTARIEELEARLKPAATDA